MHLYGEALVEEGGRGGAGWGGTGRDWTYRARGRGSTAGGKKVIRVGLRRVGALLSWEIDSQADGGGGRSDGDGWPRVRVFCFFDP